MKNLVLCTLSVLSLSLFSFALPSEGGVNRLPDGNYHVEEGACANFSPQDRATVQQVVERIYEVEPGTPNQEVHMLAVSGSYQVTEWYAYALALIYRTWRGTDYGVAMAPGSDVETLVKTLDKYAN